MSNDSDPQRPRSRYAAHADLPRPTAYAHWLTENRLARNLRQSDLAAKLGVSSGRIAELECARRRPSRQLWERIFQLLAPCEAPPWPPE